jgi:hypothetical protein
LPSHGCACGFGLQLADIRLSLTVLAQPKLVAVVIVVGNSHRFRDAKNRHQYTVIQNLSM